MINGLDLHRHYSLTSSTDIKSICNEVLNDLSITYFNYVKIYKDGSRALLTNDAPWIDHFYKHALYNTTAVVDIEYLLPKGYFLWSELKTNDPAFTDAGEYFNIDNGISFVVKQTEATILYIFASTRNNFGINNFYLRNIDLLKRFILFFNDKAHELVEKADANRIILPTKQIINDNKSLTFIEDYALDREGFLKKTEIDRYFLNKDEDLYLTKRQAECMACFLSGVTAKKIGQMFDISHRTVETYIDQTKSKFNCSSKAELIAEINSSNLRDVFDLIFMSLD